MLRIVLFGTPRIEVDGLDLEVDTRKAVALLALLALDGTQARERVADMLWPDHEPERARAALRRTLSVLRRGLGDRWVDADRSSIRLSDEDMWCDVVAFSTATRRAATHDHGREPCSGCLESLAEAVALAAGDFMAGFMLRDAPDFDDWRFMQGEELKARAGRALEMLVDLQVAAGRLEDAAETTRRWLQLDPLHEPAHQRLMQLLAWTGHRGAAVQHYRDCVALLDRELGVAPLSDTTAVYEAIRNDSLGPAPAGPPRPPDGTRPPEPPVQGGSYPLVGRSADLDDLLDAYSATGERPCVVALIGEAGIGKTSLATEFLAHVAQRGGAVLRAGCYEEERSVAYACVIQALKDASTRLAEAGVDPTHRAEAARLVPALGHPPAVERSPAAHARFLEGVAGCLAAACSSDPPGVLFVDDAQWADEGSLDVISFLLRRVETTVCVLVAWRSEEVEPGHRLHRLLGDLAREGRATAVPLRRLTRDDVTQLVSVVTPASSGGDPELVERLYQETQGVPYFVMEYLTVLRQQGSPPAGVPTGIRDLMVRRVRGAGDLARQVLAAAAVIGHRFDLDTLRHVAGRTEEETASALEELRALSLIVEDRGPAGPPSYDFVHRPLQAVVYEQTGLARRRILHRRAAEALKQRSAPPAVIAHHLMLGGLEQEAARHFFRAGLTAADVYANEEAAEHLEAALALGYPEPAVAHETLGDLATLSGAYGDALARYETAAALTSADRIPTLERKLADVHVRLGDWDAAESHLEAASGLIGPGDDGESARLLADRALVAQRRGDPQGARELAGEALAVAERCGDIGALAQAHNLLGILDKLEGRLGDSVTHLQASLELAQRLQDPQATAAALNNLALTRSARGEPDVALALAEEALRLCRLRGDRHREAALHNNVADALHALGRDDEAMSHLKEAAAILAGVGEPGVIHPEVWKLVSW